MTNPSYPDATLFMPLKTGNIWTFDYTKDSNAIRIVEGTKTFKVYKDTAMTFGADTFFLCSFDDNPDYFNAFNSFIIGNRPINKYTMYWYYFSSLIPLYDMKNFDSSASESECFKYNALPFHPNVATAFYPGLRNIIVPYGNFKVFKSDIVRSESQTNPFIQNTKYTSSFYFTKNIGLVSFKDEIVSNDSLGNLFIIEKKYYLRSIDLK
ncbi:MAG: hypothetical protein H7321_09600 [Bacteroidia bacterium]|nr:hypothetical protein [Bacteroidia bacterium]